MKLLFTKEEGEADLKQLLDKLDLRRQDFFGQIRFMNFEDSKLLKEKVERELFATNYPFGHATYEGDHRTAQMLNGRRHVLKTILQALEERL